MEPGNFRVVEMVGLAGSGKTTLCKLLTQRNGPLVPGGFPDVRKISNAPFYIWNGLKLSIDLLKIPRHNGRMLSRREYAWLAILYGWPGVLDKESHEHRVKILDQGPIYLMTETRQFGPEYLSETTAEKFWQNLYSCWEGVLDTIVWIDADDSVLIERIRNRQKGHVVKHESEKAMCEFFARYREGFEFTISNAAARIRNLKVLRYNTSNILPGDLANQLSVEFGLGEEASGK